MAVLLPALGCDPTPVEATCSPGIESGLATSGVALWVGSRLTARDQLLPGRRLRCGEQAAAWRVGLAVRSALEDLPLELRLPEVTVHFEPRIEPPSAAVPVAEVHLPSGALLVTREVLTADPTFVLLHELSHLWMRGARPRSTVPRRVLAAAEEGAADVTAALASGRSLPSRQQPSGLGHFAEPDWESLASVGGFSPHALGSALARELWPDRKNLSPAGLAACFRLPASVRATERLAESLSSLVAACSPEVRDSVRLALERWLPVTLRPTPAASDQSWQPAF